MARSIFPSQNVQHTPGLNHFFTFRCQKSVCPCGAKQISKSKVLKTSRCGRFLDAKMLFSWQAQGIAYIVKSEQNNDFVVLSPTTPATIHYLIQHTQHNFTRLPSPTLHYIPLHYTTLYDTTFPHTTRQPPPHYTTLHYTTLHYTTLLHTTLH